MTDKELLKVALKRRDEAYSVDSHNRDMAIEDKRFLTGEGHWDAEVRAERERDGKPCFTINALPQSVRQVTGQIRGMNPAIKISPGDGAASDEMAEIYEGLVRQIEVDSDASSVYEAAAEEAAQCGIGYFRVRADYVDEKSFDQQLLIERVHNSFAVLVDPLAKMPSRKDMQYCFILEDVNREAFKEEYPDADPVDISGENKPTGSIIWATSETVTVAEYFWIEHEAVKIGLTRDGQTVENPPAFLDIVKTRDARVPRVKWAKISANDVLEGPKDIPGHYIPVFAVPGEEIHVGESVFRSGVVRFAKDPQVLYNYARSTQAEVVSLQPKAPYIGTVKQFTGVEEFWNEANKSNRPYLPYNTDDKAPGPPQRQPPPVASSGLMAEIQLAAEDIKRTTGIYDAALGAKSNETSGVAIDARKQESQNSTSIYADNMVKAITHCGRVIVDMIPHIYDTRRVIRILGTDDTEKQVLINDIMQTMDGNIPVNDVRVGKYSVRVSVGPSYSTRREASAEGMMQFLNAVPAAAAVTSDLVASAQEWPDADKFAERLKKTLPPGMIEEDDMKPEQQQEIMMQRQQAEQQQQAQAQMAQKMHEIEMRKEEAQAAKAEADAARARFDAERAETEARKAQMEFATVSGEINAAIQNEIARVLNGTMALPPQF